LTQTTKDCTCSQSLNSAYDAIEHRIQVEVDEIERFEERLFQNVDKICDFTVINGISRSGQHPLAYEPKSIVICIYLYEDVTVQDTIKAIKETAIQTDLNRKINRIIKAWNIPLFFLSTRYIYVGYISRGLMRVTAYQHPHHFGTQGPGSSATLHLYCHTGYPLKLGTNLVPPWVPPKFRYFPLNS
jgi:hypothetical protein